MPPSPPTPPLPTSADWWYRRGHAVRLAEGPAKAAPWFARAMALQPEFANACIDLALTAFEGGHLWQAATAVVAGARIDPTHYSRLAAFGSALYNRGALREAAHVLAAALDAKPEDWQAAGLLGSAWLALDEPAKALPALQTARRLRPDLAQVHTLVAYALALLHRTLEAIPVCRDALRLAPDDAKSLELMDSLLINPRAPRIRTSDAEDHIRLLARDRAFRRDLAEHPRHAPLLLAYNRFRVVNAALLPHDRPRVLIGNMNETVFPNFHTWPLLRVADVVSLTHAPTSSEEPERICFDPQCDSMADILDMLPPGFVPDLFFDNQVCGEHLIPRDIVAAPFPTVAGLCHVFRTLKVLDIARLFDVVLPLSSTFVPFFRQATDRIVLDVPFGANWGSFDHLLGPAATKDIDLALTFSGVDDPVYRGWRTQLVDAVTRLRQRHGDRFRIEIVSGVDKDTYFDILGRSRIAVNAVGVNGPYNYRTCEILAAEALLMQVEEDCPFADPSMAGFFIPGREYIPFRFADFEATALHYLEEPEETRSIAAAGRRRMIEDYAYERIYESVFSRVMRGNHPLPPRAERAYGQFLHGRLHYLSEDPVMRLKAMLSLPYVLAQPTPVRNANLIALMPVLLPVYGLDVLMRALGDTPGTTALAPFADGLTAGVRALARADAGHPFTAWNALMAAETEGAVDHDQAHRLRQRLDSPDALDGVDFSQALLFVHAGSNDAGAIRAQREILNMPLLRTAAQPADLARVHRTFMQWHIERYLSAYPR